MPLQYGGCSCKVKNKKCFNILVVGETGAGKTTTIDAMSNYINGVTFYDNFRYRLIREDS